MLMIDGSHGEGGGQLLRSSLALSILTGRPFRIEKIRAGRARPGLMRQHLTALHAAAEICDARVEGDAIGASQISFEPRAVRPGDYTFNIGTAGSTTLVLQTVLLPLLLAKEPSRLVFEGGTHNPFAPPFDFLARSYLPFLNRMGPGVNAALERPGFYPAGGGRIVVEIRPAPGLTPFELLSRGALLDAGARAFVSKLPRHIAERELRVVKKELNWPDESLEVVEVCDSPGPGNILTLDLTFEHVTEVVTGFGERRRPAEAVASTAVQRVRDYLRSDAPVGEYLSDQLMLPLAVAGGGAYRSIGLSLHARTHAGLIEQFLPVRVRSTEQPDASVVVRIEKLPA